MHHGLRTSPVFEPDVVETLIDLKANHLDDDHPGRWRPGDLSELLLELIPRKVSADDEWYSSVVPTARSFLRFAAGKRALHPQSAPIQHLLQELTDIEVEFGHAVRDPARFGMAKAIFNRMGVDPDALARVLHEYAADTLAACFVPMAELGALEPFDPDDPILLTPLGVSGVRGLALERGLDAPLAPDIREFPAGAALEVITSATPELSDELALEWFSARPREQAIADLLTLARAGSAITRQSVLLILEAVGDNGLASFQADMTDDPLLRVVSQALLLDRLLVVEQMTALGATTESGLEDVIDRLGDDAAELQPLRLALLGLAWTTGDFSRADQDLLAVESLARVLEDVERPVRAHDLIAKCVRVTEMAIEMCQRNDRDSSRQGRFVE